MTSWHTERAQMLATYALDGPELGNTSSMSVF